MRSRAIYLYLGGFLASTTLAFTQQGSGQLGNEPKLRSRTDLPSSEKQADHAGDNGRWILPAGTKIPLQLRQAVSTKNVQSGDLEAVRK
jgi:hypothetical protein